MRKKKNELKVRCNDTCCDFQEHILQSKSSNIAFEELERHQKNVLQAKNKLENNGVVSVDGKLKAFGNPNYGTFIPSVTIEPSDDGENCRIAPIFLCNTMNKGFVFAAPSEDGKGSIDLGVADRMCIIGNISSPQALYVPLNNTDAIQNALAFISGRLSVSDDENEESLPSADLVW